MRRGHFVEAAAVVLALAAVYAGYMSLVWYGFDLLDEGYFLTHARRIQLGGLPYLDFDTPYTPGVFYLYAWILERFGAGMELLRAPAVIGRVVSFLALYLLARRLTSPFFAALPPLVILLIDRAPPYWSIHPGWIATPATLLAALAVVRYLDGGRARWLFWAGVATGVSFAFKQNLAAFLLMALLWLLAVAERSLPSIARNEGALTRVPRGLTTGMRVAAQWIATLLLPVSALMLVRPYLSTLVVALFVAPAALLAAVTAPVLPNGADRRTMPQAGRELSFYARPLLVLAGFTAVTLPWLLPLVVALDGRLALLRGFVGQVDPSGYYYGMAPPQWDHWRVLAISLGVPVGCGAAGAALGALLTRRWWERLALVGAVLAMAGGVVAWGVQPGQEAPLTGAIEWAAWSASESWRSYRETWPHSTDDLVLYLPSLAFWVGLAGLRGVRGRTLRQGSDPDRTVRLWYLAAGTCLLLTQYPRMGYGHIVWSGGLLYVVGADRLHALYRAIVNRVPAAGWGVARRLSQVTVGLTLTLLPAVAVLPYAQQRLDWLGTVLEAPREPTAQRAGSHLVPLALTLPTGEPRVWAAADEVRPVLGVVELLRNHSEPGEPIFVYPALPGIYYLADRPNATRFNHLFAGMASPADQEEMVRQLAGVRWVVWDDADVYNWVRPEDNAPVMEYLHRHFRTAQRFGPYVVLSREGDGEPRPTRPPA